jgi:DNA-binding YbaB/EbfC family protein
MKGGAGGGNMGDIVKKAQEAQRNLQRIQEDLKDRVVEGRAGGGAVIAFVSGQQELLRVQIKPEVVDPKDVTMLEDLVAAAVRQGIENSKKLMQDEMSRAMGGLRIPGLF